jgi:O-antigen/teichoic acid export membrane protein
MQLRRIKVGEDKSNTHQALWVVIGSLSSFSLALVSSAILSRYFSKQEYGTYKQVIYIYTTLLIIFTAGLPEVFAYFLPRYSIREGKAIVWKITRTLFLSGALFSIFLFLSSPLIASFLNNPDLEKGIKVFSPIPFLLLPTLGIEGIFSTYKKTIFIGIYNTLTRFLTLLFIVLPVIVFKGSYITAIYGWVIVSFISLLIAFYFKGIPFKGSRSEKASLSYKEIFRYSLPLVSASIWGIAIRSADQFYISRFFGSAVFAEFSNGFIQLPLVSMVTAATSIVLMPVFSKMVHDKLDLRELVAVWKSALIKSAIIIYPVVLFFMFFANDIIIVLFSKTYEASIIYFRINMAINFFNIIVFAPLLFSLGKTKLYARIHMFLAIAVWLFEYFIILVFNSPVAVAIVSVSLGIGNVAIGMIYIAKILKINLLHLIPYKEIIKIVFHVFLVAALVKVGLNKLYITSPLAELVLAFSIFCPVLLSSSRFFNLNYLSVVKPLLKKSQVLKAGV